MAYPHRLRQLLALALVSGLQGQPAQGLSSSDSGFADVLARANELYSVGRNYKALAVVEAQLQSIQSGSNAKASARAELWLLAGKLYQKTNHLSAAVHAYEEYLKLAAKAEQSDQYEALLSVLRPQATAQRSDKYAFCVNVGGAPDYFTQAISAGVFRWPLQKMPLKVHFADGTGVTGYSDDLEEVVRHSFDDWQAATRNRFAFAYVDKAEDADIEVIWTDDLHAPSLSAEAGLAELGSDSHGTSHTDIKLLTVSPFPDETMTPGFMAMISLHEIGHCLGLLGHSPYKEDVLFPSLSDQRGISSRDLATLYKLYGLDENGNGIIRGAGRDPVVENERPMSDEELKALPTAARKEMLIAEGKQLCIDKQYEKGISRYESALDLDGADQRLKLFLAVAINDLGIASQADMSLAAKYFRWALYFNPSEAIYRNNLKSFMGALGLDPSDRALRIKQADDLAKIQDYRGAVVELREAALIKNDAALAARIAEFEAKARAQRSAF